MLGAGCLAVEIKQGQELLIAGVTEPCWGRDAPHLLYFFSENGLESWPVEERRTTDGCL